MPEARTTLEGDLMAMTPRDGYLRRTYGITEAQYLAILDRQGGECAVCYKAPPPGKNLNVDHDHKTGHVRGLLCTACNYDLIGRRRDPDLFQSAALYLSQPYLASTVLGSTATVPKRKPRKRRKK